MIKPALTTLLLCALLASGCIHKIAVIQGNFLDDETIEKVKEGMTKQQVRFVLGDPVLEDSFSKDSWEYIYYLRVGRKEVTHRERLTVYFQDDKVARLERHKPDV